jgi:lactoylglutathione lyase
MNAVFKFAKPYADDAMQLPVEDVNAAIPYYEKKFHLRVVSRKDSPVRSVVLARDDIQIGLAENGGDSSQEGCFFEVNDVRAAFEEMNGVPPKESDLETQKFGGLDYLVFFDVAPDGLCYMMGERMKR